jgi:phosphate transport system substrate-binding protein
MRSLLSAIALVLSALGCVSSHAAEAAVTGTGATFPAKVYAQWAERYGRETGLVVSYLPSGSSAGIQQIKARAVDFGASDVPMAAAELDKLQLAQFPTLVGGVVPVVNLPGVGASALRLSPEVLAALFSGQITRWNDPQLTALNPRLGLPDLRVTRVVRGDGSGSTEVFVNYLKSAAPTASSVIEAQGNRAKWPGTTVAMEGSSKVSEAVKAQSGAIGYISSDYVVRDNLVPASLRNRRGDWVAPTLEAYRATIKAGGLFKDGLSATPLINLDGPGVWPIVTATYVIVPRAPASLERAGRTLNFFYSAFLLGDEAVAGSGFAPLPVAIQARIVGMLSKFQTPDGRSIPILTSTRAAPAAR